MHGLQTVLLLLIAAGIAYLIYRDRSGEMRNNGTGAPAATADDAGTRKDTAADNARAVRSSRQLAVYREVVRVLTRIGQDGDIPKDELVDFRARTHETGFLFDKDVAAYVEEVYQRALKLAGTNKALQDTKLSVGDERDAITLENSKQLIWLADQLPQLSKRFGKYLAEPDTALPPIAKNRL